MKTKLERKQENRHPTSRSVNAVIYLSLLGYNNSHSLGIANFRLKETIFLRRNI